MSNISNLENSVQELNARMQSYFASQNEMIYSDNLKVDEISTQSYEDSEAQILQEWIVPTEAKESILQLEYNCDIVYNVENPRFRCSSLSIFSNNTLLDEVTLNVLTNAEKSIGRLYYDSKYTRIENYVFNESYIKIRHPDYNEDQISNLNNTIYQSLVDYYSNINFNGLSWDTNYQISIPGWYYDVSNNKLWSNTSVNVGERFAWTQDIPILENAVKNFNAKFNFLVEGNLNTNFAQINQLRGQEVSVRIQNPNILNSNFYDPIFFNTKFTNITLEDTFIQGNLTTDKVETPSLNNISLINCELVENFTVDGNAYFDSISTKAEPNSIEEPQETKSIKVNEINTDNLTGSNFNIKNVVINTITEANVQNVNTSVNELNVNNSTIRNLNSNILITPEANISNLQVDNYKVENLKVNIPGGKYEWFNTSETFTAKDYASADIDNLYIIRATNGLNYKLIDSTVSTRVNNEQYVNEGDPIYFIIHGGPNYTNFYMNAPKSGYVELPNYKWMDIYGLDVDSNRYFVYNTQSPDGITYVEEGVFPRENFWYNIVTNKLILNGIPLTVNNFNVVTTNDLVNSGFAYNYFIEHSTAFDLSINNFTNFVSNASNDFINNLTVVNEIIENTELEFSNKLEESSNIIENIYNNKLYETWGNYINTLNNLHFVANNELKNMCNYSISNYRFVGPITGHIAYIDVAYNNNQANMTVESSSTINSNGYWRQYNGKGNLQEVNYNIPAGKSLCVWTIPGFVWIQSNQESLYLNATNLIEARNYIPLNLVYANQMFRRCTNLVSPIKFDSPTLQHARNIFDNCWQIPSVNIGIDKECEFHSAFENCRNMKAFNIHSISGNLQHINIGSYICYNCKNLTDVELNNVSIDLYSSNAFAEDTNLRNFNSAPIGAIWGNQMFRNCYNLSSDIYININAAGGSKTDRNLVWTQGFENTGPINYLEWKFDDRGYNIRNFTVANLFNNSRVHDLNVWLNLSTYSNLFYGFKELKNFKLYFSYPNFQWSTGLAGLPSNLDTVDIELQFRNSGSTNINQLLGNTTSRNLSNFKLVLVNRPEISGATWFSAAGLGNIDNVEFGLIREASNAHMNQGVASICNNTTRINNYTGWAEEFRLSTAFPAQNKVYNHINLYTTIEDINSTNITYSNASNCLRGAQFFKYLDVNIFYIINAQNFAADCPNLLEVNWYGGGNSIKDCNFADMFNNCANLQKVNIQTPNKWTINFRDPNPNKLPYETNWAGSTKSMINAFQNCYNLKTVDIWADGWTASGNSMFRNCRNLTDVNMFSAMAFAMDSAFANCYNLRNVNMPLNGYNTSVNTGDTSYHVPFMNNLFANCYNLSGDFNIKLIDIWQGVENIFTNCYNLNEVTLTNINSKIQVRNLLYNCSSVKSLNIIDCNINVNLGYKSYLIEDGTNANFTSSCFVRNGSIVGHREINNIVTDIESIRWDNVHFSEGFPNQSTSLPYLNNYDSAARLLLGNESTVEIEFNKIVAVYNNIVNLKRLYVNDLGINRFDTAYFTATENTLEEITITNMNINYLRIENLPNLQFVELNLNWSDFDSSNLLSNCNNISNVIIHINNNYEDKENLISNILNKINNNKDILNIKYY